MYLCPIIIRNMKIEADKSIIWNEAAKAGLWLGLFTGAIILVNALFTYLLGSSFGARLAGTLINLALWLVKFLGCLWLFRFFMLKFAINYSGITNKTTFRFGVLIALTSALIVSAISLANILLISQGSMQEIVDTAMQNYTSVTPLGDSERIAIERMMSWLPHISFFTTFIYCFLYGTVVAKIFSTAIPPRDIFKDDNSTDEQ